MTSHREPTDANLQGLTLSPPDPDVAEEYDVRTNAEFWGDETPIYGTFGDSAPAPLTSKFPVIVFQLILTRIHQRSFTLPWLPCQA